MPKDQMLLAVLIDADNIPAKYAPDILREITTYGEPALRRVYGDWSSSALGNWKNVVSELGLVASQETANTKGKNASDIGLVIDAMDILYTERFDGFVLVSSDSDFTALAIRLRENGVQVIGVGEEKTPASMRNVCNRFILIENLVEEEKVEAGQASRLESAPPVNTRHPPSKAVPLVHGAMKSIDPEREWYGLSEIGSYVTRANPDFDPRTFGNPKLSTVLEKTGQFELRKNSRGHLEVRRLD